MTPQETEPDMPVRAQESPAEVWVDSRLLQAQKQCLQQPWELWLAGLSLFEGGHHYHHYPYQSLASGQTQAGNTTPPISRKWA